MSEYKIGFIGAGNMGGAMIKGVIASGLTDAANIMVSDFDPEKYGPIALQYNVLTTNDNIKCAEFADVLILAVKPNIITTVISQIKDHISEDTTIISIAAGTMISVIEKAFDKRIKLIRVMPNIPVLVGEGMAALSPNEYADDDSIAKAVEIFSSFGKCEVVSESLMDAVVGVSGSSPAYVCMFIEAMADAAVLDGMPRDKAYTFAAQSVLGTAKMILDKNYHPAVLKDMVCSPGGTTICALKTLEEKGFRDAVISGQLACSQKSKDMSK